MISHILNGEKNASKEGKISKRYSDPSCNLQFAFGAAFLLALVGSFPRGEHKRTPIGLCPI